MQRFEPKRPFAQSERTPATVALLGALLLALPVHAEVETEPAAALQLDSVPAATAAPSLESLWPTILSAASDADTPKLRGDFEPSDSLLLVFMAEWTNALSRLLALVPDGVEPILLASFEETVAIGSWLESEDIDPASVTVQVADLDSPWVRDYAPLQLIDSDGTTSWIDTLYHSERTSDDVLPDLLSEHFAVSLERVDFPLDGGALISNGRGLCATTREAIDKSGVDFAEPQRHAWLPVKLGCDVLVSMPALSEEPTKHADIIAQFLDEQTVAVGEMRRESDPIDAVLLDTAVAALRRGAAALGQSLKVVRLPIERGDGNVYYSWVNGLRIGDAYAVPDYESADPELQLHAHETLAEAMSDVTLVPIPAEPMIHLGGAIHCITAQLSGPSRPHFARAPRGAKTPSP